ncbi:MAG: DegT/DnrJ/EryC1/StrS family aminotransferase [Anaerolineales bacterium]|nr:DegT/DnrJ/EryC1/StrS family aminotransferase [Anaerolineales bacterium]
MIPVAAPHAAFSRHRAALDAAYRRVLDSGRYILGPEVAAFESEFAAQYELGAAAGVANGTEALWLALRAAKVGPNDEVILPTLTASATAAAVVECGARPVFADVAPADLNLNPTELAKHLTPHTHAIIAVHLYGNPADLTALAAFCASHNLQLIEDCAQAHGARHAGRSVGTFGRAAAWSFYPTKNLGALGDGGLVTSLDLALVARARELREYGWRDRFVSAEPGWNSRLDEMQAAFLRARLPYLEADHARRRGLAAAYRAALPARLHCLQARPDDLGVEHLFVVQAPNREHFRSHLRAAGVATAIHYPVPLHLQPAYASLGGGPGSLPVAEAASAQVVSLPMYPELTDAEVAQVAGAIASYSP